MSWACGWAVAIALEALGVMSGARAEPAPAGTRLDAPRLEVTPARVLAGDPVSVRVSGLRPGELATLHARSMTIDPAGRRLPMHAAATFMADSSGAIDVATAAPVTGDYSGADARGLFWSQRGVTTDRPGHGAMAPDVGGPDSLPRGTVELTLERAGSVRDRKRVTFDPGDSGVVREPVRSRDLVGVLYHARGASRRPVVVALSGSEGGLDVADWIGPLLAARGYAVFGLAYFAPPGDSIEGVPTALERIPVESMSRARDWLATRSEVDTDRLGIVGYSKGAELALVLASTYDWIHAVAAYAPSDVVWQGIRYGGGRDVGSSWSLGGRDLPFVPTTGTRDAIVAGRRSGARVALAPVARANLAAVSPEALEAATIPIERSRAALLLIGGGDDRHWDSGASVERLAARLHRAAYPRPREILVYPAAGHGLLGTGWQSTAVDSTDPFEEGGTPEADARAQADSWARLLGFLRTALRP